MVGMISNGVRWSARPPNLRRNRTATARKRCWNGELAAVVVALPGGRGSAPLPNREPTWGRRFRVPTKGSSLLVGQRAHGNSLAVAARLDCPAQGNFGTLPFVFPSIALRKD